MIVVKPIPVTDTSLLEAQINEPDFTTGEVEWTAGTYDQGEQRIKSSTHRVYEVVADPSTSDEPEEGLLKDPPSWIDVGATNRWRMFDNKVSSQTTGANIDVFIENQPVITSVSGFNISGTDTVKVQLTTGTGLLVYEKEIIMQDDSVVGGWWDYFFEPIVAQTRFIITDLPMYPNTRLIVRTYGDAVAFGELIIGRGQNIGTAQHGTGWQGLDFSVKERKFGEYTVVAGLTADLLDYDIKLEKTKFGYVKGILKSLTGIPTVWIGNPNDINDGTAVFGYYRDAQINFTSPSLIDMTVQVEGLV